MTTHYSLLPAGITARTILSFLKVHAHPAVRARAQLQGKNGAGRLLPENVEAQIELWHRERTRVKFEEVRGFGIGVLGGIRVRVLRLGLLYLYVIAASIYCSRVIS